MQESPVFEAEHNGTIIKSFYRHRLALLRLIVSCRSKLRLAKRNRRNNAILHACDYAIANRTYGPKNLIIAIKATSLYIS
jgi:hypothetical protein